MIELKNFIESGLQNAKDENDIIKILQVSGGKLITDYYINVNGIIIEPLWVEAYFYGKELPDCNCHLNTLQKDRFGQLYFHRKGYGGLDICLSSSKEYYLSFLLKATLINGKFTKQTGIRSVIAETGKPKEELENNKDVLRKRDKTHKISFSARVGLTKPCYIDAELAAYPADVLHIYDFTFARKVLTPAVVRFAEEHKTKGYTEKECKTKCREYFGWVPDKVNEIFKET